MFLLVHLLIHTLVKFEIVKWIPIHFLPLLYYPLIENFVDLWLSQRKIAVKNKNMLVFFWRMQCNWI